ncbi:MAG: hypothetical protein LBC19_03890 [Tannerella sp.]|jgi:hypothetical protein|nr:hypothetical protein [Tannerella sp.]
MDNEDGTFRIELDKLVKWEREQLKNGSDGSDVVKLRICCCMENRMWNHVSTI